jgi:3-dehydroquinate dehydratase type I
MNQSPQPLKVAQIAVASLDELKDKIKNLSKEIELVEISADSLTHSFDTEALEMIKSMTSLPMSITFRTVKAGGTFDGKDEIWKQQVELILEIGFEYVDLQLPQIMSVDLTKKHTHTKIIASYTHLWETPGYRNLRKLYKRMRGFNPVIFRFQTKVKTQQDNLNLMRLLVSKKKNETLWVSGLGDKAEMFNQTSSSYGNFGRII